MIKPYLIQEHYQHDPWKMLVCCILLNQTTYKQVWKVVKPLFEKYPTPTTMFAANTSELIDIIRPCGFYNIRAKKLKNFSKEFVIKDWKYPIELYGIGKYANDSYRIFINNETDIVVEDKELIRYLEWLKQKIL